MPHQFQPSKRKKETNSIFSPYLLLMFNPTHELEIIFYTHIMHTHTHIRESSERINKEKCE